VHPAWLQVVVSGDDALCGRFLSIAPPAVLPLLLNKPPTVQVCASACPARHAAGGRGNLPTGRSFRNRVGATFRRPDRRRSRPPSPFRTRRSPPLAPRRTDPALEPDLPRLDPLDGQRVLDDLVVVNVRPRRPTALVRSLSAWPSRSARGITAAPCWASAASSAARASSVAPCSPRNRARSAYVAASSPV
jgi:hypothetical protein